MIKGTSVFVFVFALTSGSLLMAADDLPEPNGKDNYSAYMDCKILAGEELDDAREVCTDRFESDLNYDSGSAHINNYSCRKDADKQYERRLDSCKYRYLPSKS